MKVQAHISLEQGSDKPGKPGKNSVFLGTLRENLENSGNFAKIFQILGKLIKTN